MALRLWVAQLALNALWTPLFFGAHRLGWAFVEILVMLATIVATVVCLARVDRRAAGVMVPYLGWVSFASLLNGWFVAIN